MKKLTEYIMTNYNTDERKDIIEHGCVSGCASGLIYYTETVAFHDEYEEEIWDLLDDDADNQGVTIIELIANFNGQKDVGSIWQFKNLLSWYAVEKICFDIENGEEK